MMRVFPRNSQTWLICGGRDFSDAGMMRSVMIDLMTLRGCPDRVVHGGAKGADTLAGEWAKRMALDVIEVRAEWDIHGRAAGPIRNQKMLDEYRPDFVVAFPGGRGTAHMVRISRAAGVDVAEIVGGEE